MVEGFCRKCGELRELEPEDGRCYSCIFDPAIQPEEWDSDDFDDEIETDFDDESE